MLNFIFKLFCELINLELMNDTSWKTKTISIWHNRTAESEGGSLAMHHVSILTSGGHSENDRGFLTFEQLIPL